MEKLHHRGSDGLTNEVEFFWHVISGREDRSRVLVIVCQTSRFTSASVMGEEFLKMIGCCRNGYQNATSWKQLKIRNKQCEVLCHVLSKHYFFKKISKRLENITQKWNKHLPLQGKMCSGMTQPIYLDSLNRTFNTITLIKVYSLLQSL